MKSISLFALVATLSACAGVTTVRNGGPVLLPSGTATNACESKDWLELVPTRTFASASRQVGGGYGYTLHEHVSREAPGYSVYRLGRSQPEDLERLLPELDEPMLTGNHLARTEPIRDSQSAAKGFWLTGLGLTVAGLAGMLATVEDGGPVFSASAGVSVVGLLLELVSVGIQPNASESTYANIRKQTLIAGEDDIAAARRGISKHNQSVRRRCHTGKLQLSAR